MRQRFEDGQDLTLGPGRWHSDDIDLPKKAGDIFNMAEELNPSRQIRTRSSALDALCIDRVLRGRCDADPRPRAGLGGELVEQLQDALLGYQPRYDADNRRLETRTVAATGDRGA
jgi:hypothetical protein